MLNFTVGPVQMSERTRKIGGEQVPYFRTTEFSNIMFDNEKLIKEFAGAGDNSRAIFVTGSGTASMEATIMNVLSKNDKALIINGGSFGQRFVDLCKIYDIPYEELKIESGKKLTEEMLNRYENSKFTAFLVNVHETSTGVLYDMNLISSFCKENKLLLIADMISSFLADPFNMNDLGVDVMITGSQKALACAPGISIIILSERAIQKVKKNDVKSLYFNLKLALKNAERGQTPFTPAVGILRQINSRLNEINLSGGANEQIKRTSRLATDFRKQIKNLPFKVVSESLSNAVTPLHPMNVSAYEVFLTLKNDYGIWICPNGGNMKDKIFRVGHIGDLTLTDNKKLISAFNDMKLRKLL